MSVSEVQSTSEVNFKGRLLQSLTTLHPHAIDMCPDSSTNSTRASEIIETNAQVLTQKLAEIPRPSIKRKGEERLSNGDVELGRPLARRDVYGTSVILKTSAQYDSNREGKVVMLRRNKPFFLEHAVFDGRKKFVAARLIYRYMRWGDSGWRLFSVQRRVDILS